MNTIVEKVSFQFERLYPAAFAIVGATVGFLAFPDWINEMEKKHFVTENLFVAVFTLGTVAAGFGLTIYTFVLTAETGFIGRAKRSVYFKNMIYYLLVAVFLSTVLAVLSVPGMIIKEDAEKYSPMAVYYGAWLGTAFWAGASMYRALYIFSIFSREHH